MSLESFDKETLQYGLQILKEKEKIIEENINFCKEKISLAEKDIIWWGIGVFYSGSILGLLYGAIINEIPLNAAVIGSTMLSFFGYFGYHVRKSDKQSTDVWNKSLQHYKPELYKSALQEQLRKKEENEQMISKLEALLNSMKS